MRYDDCRSLYQGSGHFSRPTGYNAFWQCNVCFELMNTDARRQKRRDKILSSLNVAIEALDLAEKISCIVPAKAVFGSASLILTMIRVVFF